MGFLPILLEIGGTIMKGVSQRREAKEQAKWMRYNAAVAESKAASERRAATYEAGVKREEGRKLLARQLNLFAKAGISPQVGSPLIMMADTTADIERDARITELEGREAGRYYESEAGLQRAMAKSVKRAGKWSAGTTFLTGFGQAGLDYYDWKKGRPKKSSYTDIGRATTTRY